MKGFDMGESMKTDTLTNYFKPILYKFHDREAIVFKTGFRSIRISYLDLYDYSYRMANWYQHNGLKKGDAILIWAPNSPEWVAALLACSITGVIAVPLDMRVKPNFVRHIAGETGAKAGIKSKFMNIESELNWWDTQDLSRQVHEAPPIFKEPELSTHRAQRPNRRVSSLRTGISCRISPLWVPCFRTRRTGGFFQYCL